jgi:bacterial/archaeal transporter family-2 protein
MLCSLVIDHFGLFAVITHQASPSRIAGAALLAIGVLLIRH